MKLYEITHHIGYGIAMLALVLGWQSCREERFDIPDYTVTGEEVTLDLKVTLPAMDAKTRASLDEASLNEVQSLWIRTYSADTGKATSDWFIVADPSNTGTETDHEVTLATQSGSSYIVAVANVANLGVTKDNIDNPQPLSTLLTAADTWSDFLNIAVVSPSDQDRVNAPRTPLPMVGCFSDVVVGGDHPEPTRLDEWQTKDFQPYFIPVKKGPVDFRSTGAIHLRRLVSHITFNVIPGNDNIDVTVNSYQVLNAPRFSWLYERPASDGMLTNFGDMATSEADAARYYAEVPQFGNQFIRNGENGSSTFDFWQGENKHKGLDDLSSYKDRDLKNGTLFTNLTGETWTPNNEASYVLVQCTVDYKNSLQVGDQGQLQANGTTVYRTGEISYLVHLGYVGSGTEAEKARDFNCFRNVDYTYNLTVNGINDVRVDAWATDETNHGEEGIVVDLANSTIDLDAHYAAFNIQLTETELRGDFGFIITTYDNGNQITITDANQQRGAGSSIEILDRDGQTVIDPKYYNWIELRPTTGQNVLAEYKPRFQPNSDGKTFLLTDLKASNTSTAWDVMASAAKSTSGWYTVFVNEYTYEPMYTGTEGYANEEWNGQGGRPGWMSYVNQNPRRFYIRVTQSTSPDGNSLYARSKYGVSQQSLMTYYSDQTFAPASGNIPAGTAIGVERENETNGMNLVVNYTYGSSEYNGRYNVASYLSSRNGNRPITSTNVNNRPAWDGYINQDSPLEVGAVTGFNRIQGGSELPARTIASGNPAKIPGVVISTTGPNYTFTDPQQNNNYRIEAITACMSRNRDNNGNGRIDPDELRWFVPAINQYLQLMMGSRALPDPMMDYQRISQLPYVNSNTNANVTQFQQTAGYIKNDFYSRYMFVASNDGTNVLWGMEGTSLSTYGNLSSWTSNRSHPWQVRCIRNLGADLSTVTSDNKVANPYVHDAANRTFRVPYLNTAAIRVNAYPSNGTGASQMPIHTINSLYNRLYYGFEYAEEDIVVPDGSRNVNDLVTYINGNPCSTVGTGFRVPNQEELALIVDAHLLTAQAADNTDLWVSCTASYFQHNNGVGNSETNNKYLLGALSTNGTQATPTNIGNAGNNLKIRCVRDINN